MSRITVISKAVLLAILLCAACQKAEDREAQAPEPEARTQQTRGPSGDGTLVIALDLEPDEGFDPLMGWGGYGTPLFQSTLLKRTPEQGLEGDLAEHWELSEDRRIWRVRIRRDASFSDGKPVTARDVAFTFNQAARAGGKTDVTVLEEAVATGEHTVEIRLRVPQITFVNRLITLGIVPAHAYGEDYGRNPVGSGPYRMVQWEEGRQLIMEANPDYYGTVPRIQRVVFVFMEEDAAFAAARAGEVHVIRVPQILARKEIPGMSLHAIPSVDNRGICFPCVPVQETPSPEGHPVGNDVTADLAVRKAVNWAVDREALVEGILEGFGSPAHGPVSTLPWDQPEAVIQDGDLDRARRILEEGGWTDADGDGTVEKDGKEAVFTLLYPANDSLRQALALAVSDSVRKVGIEAEVTGKSWDDIYRMMHANAVLFGFGSLDQTEMHNLYYGERIGDNLHNAGFYRNPTVDRHLEGAMAAPSLKQAVFHWRQAQWDGETGYCARGDAAWAWLVNLDHTYFVDRRLDVGDPATEQHGSFIIANLPQWSWVSERGT